MMDWIKLGLITAVIIEGLIFRTWTTLMAIFAASAIIFVIWKRHQ